MRGINDDAKDDKLREGTDDCSFRARVPRVLFSTIIFGAVPLLTSCHGIQSALEPAGREAEQIARLFCWMTGGGVAVWIAVVALGIYAVRTRTATARRTGLLIKASSGHWAITRWFLNFAKERSVATHTLGKNAPSLEAPWLVVEGATHYETGCRSCHGSRTCRSRA